MPLQAGSHQRIHREALSRQTGGCSRDITKAHRAVASERRDPSVGVGRHHGSQHAFGDLAAVLAHEKLRVERLRPWTEASDCHHLLLVGEIDHDRRDTGDVDEIALQDAERNPRGATRIDRVAACLQDVEPRGRREIVTRRNRVLRDGDRRPMRRWCGHGEPFCLVPRCATVALDRPPLEEAL